MIEHPPLPRRDFLARSGLGFGALALNSLLERDTLATDAPPITGHPHFAPKAKNVIWLFMRGGVSHMESFDPKPELNRYAGQSIGDTPYKHTQESDRLKNVRVVVVNDANGQRRKTIYPLQVSYRKHGQSGIEVSDWFPHIGSCIDDIAVLRGMWTTDDNHGAQVQFHSGRHTLDGRFPTIGSWVTYGLGSLNENLPQFVNIGPRYFGKRDSYYLGPAYDAVTLKVDPNDPLPFAKPEGDLTNREQRLEFNLINRLNRITARKFPDDAALEARIKSYELAFRMQTAVPEVLSTKEESDATKKLYGLDNSVTKPFGEQLLVARRMAERGVRFIQLMHGTGAAGAWDAHKNLKSNHTKLSAQVDLPVAGLLKDLKQRGMLKETMVVFATEFGRTPGSQRANGRDHHPFGFSVWMAGGGIKGAVVHGSTDEIGFHAEEGRHYVTDVHATLLHQLGLDRHSMEIAGHKRLERDFGNVIDEIVA
ncbi:MAG: sulfatase [Verrucomicrobiales bacterium]|nr:sulfatase [Verrucomicrobiales bacterium]